MINISEHIQYVSIQQDDLRLMNKYIDRTVERRRLSFCARGRWVSRVRGSCRGGVWGPPGVGSESLGEEDSEMCGFETLA